MWSFTQAEKKKRIWAEYVCKLIKKTRNRGMIERWWEGGYRWKCEHGWTFYPLRDEGARTETASGLTPRTSAVPLGCWEILVN